uniref:Uncharacterized protein n=1 Tax=Glossina brevipalpis TaxID=37001 RepID=A0A1A9X0D0_9MUSC
MCTTTATSPAAARKWHLMFLILSALLIQTPYQAAAEKSKHYYMQSLCKNHFLQQLYRKIDGAVLWSQNERNLDCIITFQTHSILQRFMLRFDMLQLDCNDHLYVYDGAHAVATPKLLDLVFANRLETTVHQSAPFVRPEDIFHPAIAVTAYGLRSLSTMPCEPLNKPNFGKQTTIY